MLASRHWFLRGLSLVLAVLFACALPASIPALAEEEVRYIAPTLPSDADPYDPEHPENLDEDQLYALPPPRS